MLVNFTWKPFFEELLAVLCSDYNSESLAQLAHEIFHDAPLTDQFKDGSSGPVNEFDPLTFIGYFNRSLTDEHRISYCRAIKYKLNLKSEAPSDVTGIPTVNNQASWFFPYSKFRGNEDFQKLWHYAKALDEGQLSDVIFDDALKVKGVGLTNLTQICFICKPEHYLPLDKNTSKYLSSNGLEESVKKVRESESYSDYQSLLARVREKFPSKQMAEISANAYKDSVGQSYWLVGATWSDADKSSEFIKNSEWINGFDAESGDKSIDKVRKIAVDDLIAIKSAFTKERRISCIRIKAVGRVTENKGDGRHLKVDWDFTGDPFDIDGARYMHTVHEVTDPEDQKLIFHNSYRSARKDSVKSDSGKSKPTGRTADLPKNLILYGPPGVGKTHEILQLRERFTSSGDNAESTRITRWVAEQSWWTVTAAAVIDLNRTVSVSEIASHPFVQEKIKQSVNKTPRNTLWSLLQRHTIRTSKTVNFEQRDEPLVFDKTEDSKWFLTGDWEEALTDIKAEVNALRRETGETFKRYELVTFHQAYSYEEFVEGIRPVTTDESNSLTYTIERGIFKRMCERAKADPTNEYAIFIDEINRGNIAKIFGELITLIEDDKRDGAKNATIIVLPYSKTYFSVPANLYVIGTMNTVDRSIALLDIALRRRFRFQRINPKPELVVEKIDGINVRAIFAELNDRISVLLGEDYQLGHSYFMADRITSAEDLKAVWFECILPLLQEYFFDDWDKLRALVPSFVEFREIRGLDNLGLLNSSRFSFTSRTIETDHFMTRLKALSSFLRVS